MRQTFAIARLHNETFVIHGRCLVRKSSGACHYDAKFLFTKTRAKKNTKGRETFLSSVSNFMQLGTLYCARAQAVCLSSRSANLVLRFRLLSLSLCFSLSHSLFLSDIFFNRPHCSPREGEMHYIRGDVRERMRCEFCGENSQTVTSWDKIDDYYF